MKISSLFPALAVAAGIAGCANNPERVSYCDEACGARMQEETRAQNRLLLATHFIGTLSDPKLSPEEKTEREAFVTNLFFESGPGNRQRILAAVAAMKSDKHKKALWQHLNISLEEALKDCSAWRFMPKAGGGGTSATCVDQEHKEPAPRPAP